MLNRVLGIAESACTVIGAFVAYVLVAGSAAGYIIRRAKRRTPAIRGSSWSNAGPERRARGWGQISGWQNRAQNWAVVVVLLGAPAIAARTEPFVDFSNREVDWLGLLLEADQWSKPDRLLVHVAYDLVVQREDEGAFGRERAAMPVAVADLITEMDQPRTDLVHAAVNLRRGACTYEKARRISARTS